MGFWSFSGVQYPIKCEAVSSKYVRHVEVLLRVKEQRNKYEGWNFNSGNYLFTTDTK